MGRQGAGFGRRGADPWQPRGRETKAQQDAGLEKTRHPNPLLHGGYSTTRGCNGPSFSPWPIENHLTRWFRRPGVGRKDLLYLLRGADRVEAVLRVGLFRFDSRSLVGTIVLRPLGEVVQGAGQLYFAGEPHAILEHREFRRHLLDAIAAAWTLHRHGLGIPCAIVLWP